MHVSIVESIEGILSSSLDPQGGDALINKKMTFFESYAVNFIISVIESMSALLMDCIMRWNLYL